jgi:hypothetical protein
VQVIPSLVTALSGQGITDIVCGKAFSVALTDGVTFPSLAWAF